MIKLYLLDFGKFKTDVVNKVPAAETESFKESTNKSLQQLSERLPDHFKSVVSQETSSDLKKGVKGMAQPSENDEQISPPTENKVKGTAIYFLSKLSISSIICCG